MCTISGSKHRGHLSDVAEELLAVCRCLFAKKVSHELCAIRTSLSWLKIPTSRKAGHLFCGRTSLNTKHVYDARYDRCDVGNKSAITAERALL